MAWNNRVIWSEGMFLRPQHFQQHDRFLESLVDGRASKLCPYSWGFSEIQIDERALALGTVAIASARGVLPDGTPFNVPADDDPPMPVSIGQDVKNCVVHLTLPQRRVGMEEASVEEQVASLARFKTTEYEVRDSNAGMDSRALMQVGKPRLKLLLDSDDLSAYTRMGVVRVVEKRADGQVVLDDQYIPPCLDCRASRRMTDYVREIVSLLHHRGEALAQRVAQPAAGGVAEIATFLMLQTVNRQEPVFMHLARMTGLHPERLYLHILALAGELATFSASNRRPMDYPEYRHDALQDTLLPVMEDLRHSLSKVIEQNAIPIGLDERKYGIRVAQQYDHGLLTTANFILAVKANMSPETVRSRFPAQAKMGPVERIRDLVNLALPGIGLYPLPVAPRQIPFHAGYTYFELDRSSDLWKELNSSGGFALHVSGEFPGIELEFWAIRE